MSTDDNATNVRSSDPATTPASVPLTFAEARVADRDVQGAWTGRVLDGDPRAVEAACVRHGMSPATRIDEVLGDALHLISPIIGIMRLDGEDLHRTERLCLASHLLKVAANARERPADATVATDATAALGRLRDFVFTKTNLEPYIAANVDAVDSTCAPVTLSGDLNALVDALARLKS